MELETSEHRIDIGGNTFIIRSVTNFDELYEQLVSKGLRHEDVADERIPYWAELWPSAVGLASHLALNSSLLIGKSVLEIGCGLGLPSIVASFWGGTVTATDYLQDAVEFAGRNAAINGLNGIKFEAFDWRMPEGYGQFDLLLASDVVYERSQFDHLKKAFSSLVKPGGLILLSEPNRYIAAPFIESLFASGYTYEKDTYSVNIKEVKSIVSVYEISKISTY